MRPTNIKTFKILKSFYAILHTFSTVLSFKLKIVFTFLMQALETFLWASCLPESIWVWDPWLKLSFGIYYQIFQISGQDREKGGTTEIFLLMLRLMQKLFASKFFCSNLTSVYLSVYLRFEKGAKWSTNEKIDKGKGRN